MTSPARIAVIGGGAWGTALAQVAAAAGCEAVLWMRDAEAAARVAATGENARYLPGLRLDPRIRPTASLDEAAGTDAVLLVTPAQTTRAMMTSLRPVLAADTPLVLCAKGIERGTGAFLSDVAAAVRPGAPLGVLSGPSFASDVAAGLPTAVVLASADGPRAARRAAHLAGPAHRV